MRRLRKVPVTFLIGRRLTSTLLLPSYLHWSALEFGGN